MYRVPTQIGIYLIDSCCLGPQYPNEVEKSAVETLFDLDINLALCDSLRREVHHPNAPKGLGDPIGWHTFDKNLTEQEKSKLAEITEILVGNSTDGKHHADARHVFEAHKYFTYFITLDERVLKRAKLIEEISNANICSPSTFLERLEA
jgi:hypothetical protein